jgi:hypothetical protein
MPGDTIQGLRIGDMCTWTVGAAMNVRPWWKLGLAVSVGVALYMPVCAADEESSGQNPLRPVRQVNLKYKYENLEKGAESHQLMTQLVERWDLGDDDELGLQLDLPVRREREENTETGLGDILLQASAIRRKGRYRVETGLRTIVPSASHGTLGREKWDVAPLMGGSVDLPSVGRGSFISLVSRYRVSVAGAENEPDTNRLEFEAKFNVHLRDRWYVEVRYPGEVDLENGGRLRSPVGVELGRRISESFIASIKPEFFITDRSESQQFSIESRVGVFF